MMSIEIELEPEVAEWYSSLTSENRDVVAVHIELLEEFGHLLRIPHSRALADGLFELRFTMGRRAWRITYWHRGKGIYVLLTVFSQQQGTEQREIARARKALTLCRDAHLPETT
jgi:phage-related protein